MVKNFNVMYQIKENEVVIYSITACFEGIDQCYEECCSYYASSNKSAKELTDLDIDKIFDENLCCGLLKKQTGFIDEYNRKIPVYSIEYKQMMKPYPKEIQVLSQLKNGNFNELKQWLSIVNSEIKNKPYLKDINDKLFDSIEMTVVEKIPFDNMYEALIGLVDSTSVNRELQYSSSVLARYYLNDEVMQKIKK